MTEQMKNQIAAAARSAIQPTVDQIMAQEGSIELGVNYPPGGTVPMCIAAEYQRRGKQVAVVDTNNEFTLEGMELAGFDLETATIILEENDLAIHFRVGTFASTDLLLIASPAANTVANLRQATHSIGVILRTDLDENAKEATIVVADPGFKNLPTEANDALKAAFDDLRASRE